MRSAAPPSIFILACLGLVACAGGEAPEPAADAPGTSATPHPGRLVIVGGGLDEDNVDIYRAILGGRDGDGPLCVLPTASGVPESSMASAVASLGRYAGAGAVSGVPLTAEDADRATDPALVVQLEGCGGYFFTGGDQSRVVDTFLPAGDTTPAYRAVRRRWLEGAVISGSSAGAAMMSGVMIASGSSAEAVEHGAASSEGGGVWIRRGMGFFERAILDQHFLARGRVGRLLVATLATHALPLGLGIDENTALVVEGDTARVVGASGVVVVDARGAVADGKGFATGIRMELAGAGDRIDLGTLAVRRGAGKTPLAPTPAAFEPPPDPFARWAFLHVLSGLSGSSDEGATFALASAVLSVREGVGFSAASAPREGVQGEPHGLSAGPFVIDLVPASTSNRSPPS